MAGRNQFSITHLEGVVESQPVSYFVGHSSAEVVVGGASAWDRGIQHDDPIVHWVTCVVPRERCVSEQTLSASRNKTKRALIINSPLVRNGRNIPNGINVQCIGGALAKSRFHVGLNLTARFLIVSVIALWTYQRLFNLRSGTNGFKPGCVEGTRGLLEDPPDPQPGTVPIQDGHLSLDLRITDAQPIH